MKKLSISQLHNPRLLYKARELDASGRIAISSRQLTYLKVDDAWIHELFPCLPDPLIQKPDYFGEDAIGAHISIIYPEENKAIRQDDLDQKHQFKIRYPAKATLQKKSYYVLIVEAPSLTKLRKKYGLPERLCFKGYFISFHITLGVEIDKY